MSDPFGWLGGAENRNPIEDASEQNEAMLKEAAIYDREEARLFYDVFATGRGPELLEYLRGKTIELDLMSVSKVVGSHLREMGVNPSEWAYHRNGQNSVVRWIEERVQRAALPEAEDNDNA